MCTGLIWLRDGIHWQAVVNSLVQLWAPLNNREFARRLTDRRTVASQGYCYVEDMATPGSNISIVQIE